MVTILLRESATKVCAVLLLLLALPPVAAPAPAPPLHCADQAAFGPGSGPPDALPGLVPAQSVRSDTVWFGGDNGSGVAVAGGVWDFEEPGSNGFQGWVSIDLTENPGDYFGRVTAVDFTTHGDPCVPIQTGNVGMLWCGIHQDEACLRDFIGGMGYQNMMCQRAFSPAWPIDPSAEAVDLSFFYFNNSEPEFDYTHADVLCRDAAGGLLATHELMVVDGVIGSPAGLVVFGAAGPEIAAGTLDPATATIQLELRCESDGGWSDEDGLWDTPCGPFGADDVAVTVGATAYAYDFEDGPQGWTFERCAGQGSFMAVHDEAVWRDWVEETGTSCRCPLTGKVLGMADAEQSPYFPPGLVPGQKELVQTGAVPRAGYSPPEWNRVIAGHDQFISFAQPTGAHYRSGWKLYPYTTEVNPEPHWSRRHGPAVWYYTSSPVCAHSLVDLSAMADEPLPVAWDSLKYTFEVYCSCDGFSTPPSVCIEEGATQGSPLLDNVRLGLTHVADAPPITMMDGGRFMDSYGQNYPLYLEPTDRGNANVSYDISMGNTEQNDWHGDSSVVAGPVVSGQASRFLCQFCFRIPRVGARQELIPEYHAWKSRLLSDPEEGWVCALMDSLELNNHTQVWKNKFATYFHEDDPGFAQGQPDSRPAQEILPDGVFVPGTRVEYYFRSHWFNGGAPPEEFFVLGPLEFEVLPTMTLIPGEEYAVQWSSVLYVDAFNRGSEEYINTLLEEADLSFDRFDYLENSS